MRIYILIINIYKMVPAIFCAKSCKNEEEILET